MTKKGFSLVELVIALGIVIIMTGAAALYLGDIFFKSQVAKSLGDMETIANALLLHDTENGSDIFETELPGQESNYTAYLEKDKLTNLLGTYLAVLPDDPWGNTYIVNSYAGWVRTYNSDYKINGTSKYEKDISAYYLPEDLVVSKVRVEDSDLSLAVDTGDTIYIYFTKSVRCNITTAANATDGPPATALARTVAGGGLPGSNANGWFDAQDFNGIQPDGTETDQATAASVVDYAYSRPVDSPYTYSDFSKRLVLEDPTGLGDLGQYETVWKIGNYVYIPTGVDTSGTPTDDRSPAYCIWESTQGYLNYKTTGEKSKIYLKVQGPETAKRVVLFKDLVD